MEENIEYISQESNQPTFAEVLAKIIRSRRKIIRFAIIFLVLGILVALLSPKEYTSSSIVLPQISSSKGLSKKYSGIAALVGIKLGESEGSNIVPTLYPVIVKSAPFQKELLKTPIKVSQVDTLIPMSYYLSDVKKDGFLATVKGYTIGLPGKIISAFKSNEVLEASAKNDSSIYRFSPTEKAQIEYLNKHLSITFNEIEGYLDFKATMSEPLASAQLVENAQALLQEFIINYNIKKSKDELQYIEERFSEVKDDYASKRASLGSFRDRNQNLISSYSLNRQEQLNAEYELAYAMYSQLAGQLESAKLQVKKDTPIFTILKPVTIPLEASGPDKVKIILLSVFLGIFLSVAITLFRLYYPIFREYIRKS